MIPIYDPKVYVPLKGSSMAAKYMYRPRDPNKIMTRFDPKLKLSDSKIWFIYNEIHSLPLKEAGKQIFFRLVTNRIHDQDMAKRINHFATEDENQSWEDKRRMNNQRFHEIITIAESLELSTRHTTTPFYASVALMHLSWFDEIGWEWMFPTDPGCMDVSHVNSHNFLPTPEHEAEQEAMGDDPESVLTLPANRKR
ncbi:hypothetical protein ACHAPC_009599 [Botrytis cinerea]